MFKNLGILSLLSVILSALVGGILMGVNIWSSHGIGWVIGYGFGSILFSIVLCGIPASIYWIIKRNKMPGFDVAIWVVWVLIFVIATIGNLM